MRKQDVTSSVSRVDDRFGVPAGELDEIKLMYITDDYEGSVVYMYITAKRPRDKRVMFRCVRAHGKRPGEVLDAWITSGMIQGRSVFLDEEHDQYLVCLDRVMVSFVPGLWYYTGMVDNGKLI